MKRFLPYILVTLLACNGCPTGDTSPESPDSGGADAVDAWLDRRAAPVETPEDLAPVVEETAGAELVMLGEATRGTAEFYEWRSKLTLQLAEAQRIDFVALEADWGAARALDRYVTGYMLGDAARDDVERRLVDHFADRPGHWPWANAEFAEFIRRLRDYNERHPDDPIRIYGLDMQNVVDSVEWLVDRIQTDHPGEADAIVDDLDCLREFSDDFTRYGSHVRADEDASCKEETARVEGRVRTLYGGDGMKSLSVRRHARIVAAGEARQRRRRTGEPNEHWNIRAAHMAETTESLLDYHGESARGVVWAHNTQIGDGRGTEMPARNRINLTDRLRKSRGEDAVYTIGTSTARGEVMARRHIELPPRTMEFPEAADGSLDAALARHPAPRFVVRFDADDRDLPFGDDGPGQRAVDRMYHPEREVPGNYEPTDPARRWDALLFLDETGPVEPLW